MTYRNKQCDKHLAGAFWSVGNFGLVQPAPLGCSSPQWLGGTGRILLAASTGVVNGSLFQGNALSPASPISKALTTSTSPSAGFVSTYLPRTAWKIPFL